MASITKRKTGKKAWFASVRRVGARGQAMTFSTKTEAQAWARQIENDIDRGKQPAAQIRLTIGALIDL